MALVAVNGSLYGNHRGRGRFRPDAKRLERAIYPVQVEPSLAAQEPSLKAKREADFDNGISLDGVHLQQPKEKHPLGKREVKPSSFDGYPPGHQRIPKA